MNNWVLLNLGDALLAGNQLSRLQKNLIDLYHRYKQPDSFAAYYRYESS